tara:strand:+ start:586 stop:1416 length:831 start_codon:yes stop_codon:yes gene_type:complete
LPGKLGGAIIKALIQEIGKENVVGIARNTAKAAHLGVEVRKGDYNNREDFNEALQGIDKVLLISGSDKPERRVAQHQNVIEAAKQNGVQKMVYTSIVGDEKNTAFSPVVQSNRQTEDDVRNSGIDFIIGRNGIYIEPDLEYIDTYIKEGGIINCAADGKCGYTSRKELGDAYSQLLLNDNLNGKTLNLVGEGITQSQLADYINQVYGTTLSFKNISVEAYKKERQSALGDFLGTIIAGIYEGIRNEANDVTSDFETAAGRPHKSALELIQHNRLAN